MPIRPFLSNQSFDPEIIGKMSAALERVCETLNLKMVDDPATRLVAEKIIGLVQRGVQDTETLHAMAWRSSRAQLHAEGAVFDFDYSAIHQVPCRDAKPGRAQSGIT
jgi:hypothetical protein